LKPEWRTAGVALLVAPAASRYLKHGDDATRKVRGLSGDESDTATSGSSMGFTSSEQFSGSVSFTPSDAVSSSSEPGDDEAGSDAALIAGIVAGALAIIAVVVIVVLRRWKSGFSLRRMWEEAHEDASRTVETRPKTDTANADAR